MGSSEAAEMARAMGSVYIEAEREVRGEEGAGRSFGGAVPLPMLVVLGAGARGGVAGGGVAGGGGVDLVPKEPFTVRVKDGREWTAARHLTEKLQDFVTEVQRNALLLKLIDDDERILRLQLPGPNGSQPQELDVDATLGDVRICMGADKVLLAVIAKPAPAAPIPSRVPATTPLGTRPDTNYRDQASPTVAAGVVERRDFEPGTNTKQPSPVPVPGSHQKCQPSSSSANVTNPLPVPPSRGVDTSHHGNKHPERSVVIKRRVGPEIRVTESDLNSQPHLTLMDKATSLGVSLAALKNARIQLELGRWPGRQERARLRRSQAGRSVENSRNSAERSPKRSRTEGAVVIASTKQEFP